MFAVDVFSKTSHTEKQGVFVFRHLFSTFCTAFWLRLFVSEFAFKFLNVELFPKHIDSSVMSYYNHFVTMHKHVASKKGE